MNKEKKISRNDRCEATGKKFKNCYLLKNQKLRIKKLLNRRPLQEN